MGYSVYGVGCSMWVCRSGPKKLHPLCIQWLQGLPKRVTLFLALLFFLCFWHFFLGGGGGGRVWGLGVGFRV